MENVIEGMCWYVAFLFSVTVHEAAHAWMAKLGGDMTAYNGGQVSLDPLPHIRREPFGTVVFPLLSLFVLRIGWPFGYASAPYDPEWAERYPRRAAIMAAAGPFSNLTLAIISGLLIRLGVAAGVFAAPASVDSYIHVVNAHEAGFWSNAAVLISMLFSLNLILTILNLIPFPPLDGSSAITFFMSEEQARKYRSVVNNPMFGIIGILVAWNIFNPLFEPIFVAALNVLYFPAHRYG
jgi:Zn-dependent protease